MKITTARYCTPSGRCIQKLQYDEKDEFGKATVKSNDKKKIFKTKNGRIVYDAGGIDPDVFLPLFNGAQLIQWLEKEFFIFDWSNKYIQSHPEYLKTPELIQTNILSFQSDFEQYVLNKSPKIMQKNWQNYLLKQGTDSLWTQQIGLYTIDEKKLTNFLSTGLASQKNQIASQLQLALFKRCLKAEKYFYNSLKIDNEIEHCIDILNAPEKIKIILKQ
jgi:carboxyl-terminal processing protease